MTADDQVVIDAVVKALAYNERYEAATRQHSYIRPVLTPIDIGHIVLRNLREAGA